MTHDALERLSGDVFGRLEQSRIGQRMQIALAVLATGESYRASAHSVGYRDHRDLRRLAKRFGFDRLHREQRRQRQLERIGAELERMQAQLVAGKRLGLRAHAKALDYYFALRDAR
jgi:hypothetical protein